MKIKNEVKVGILAIAAILILVIGFNFLKGKNLFSKAIVVYAIFQNLGSLEKSNQVKINGLPVGTVYNYAPTDREVNSIIVEIHLNNGISIPRNSVAFIDGSLVGSAYVNISKGNANSFLAAGDTISTRLDQGFIADLRTQLTPTVTRVNSTLDSLKYTISGINKIFDPATNTNIQSLIANLAKSTAHLQQLLDAQTGILVRSLNNVNAITGNLAKNNEAINESIRNVQTATGKLANAKIEETVSSLDSTIIALRGTAEELKTTINQLNTNNGTLGLLMKDRKLYDQLNSAALGAEILIDDLRLHPKRYVNISVFGGRNKGEPLTSPSLKDTVPIPVSNHP